MDSGALAKEALSESSLRFEVGCQSRIHVSDDRSDPDLGQHNFRGT